MSADAVPVEVLTLLLPASTVRRLESISDATAESVRDVAAKAIEEGLPGAEYAAALRAEVAAHRRGEIQGMSQEDAERVFGLR
jgi:hypothetical protein